MARYHYKARGQRGDALEGILDASSPDAVASQLVNSGITPIDIVEHVETEDVLANFREKLARRPGLQDLILFSRQMYTLTRASVPIIRAITGLAESTNNKVMAKTLHAVADSLQGGRTLSTALGQHPDVFPNIFISIIGVGENTGQLEESFMQLSHYLELEKETRDSIKAAMRYPVFVIVAITIAMFVINIFVIPAFASVFNSFKAELPWATQVLMATSQFSVAYWPYILVATVASYIGLHMYVRTDDGHYLWDKLKLRIPVVGSVIRRATLGRFARSFSMAVRAGVPLIQSLTIVARAVDNLFIGERILQMRNGVERGDSLTRTASASNMFTPLVIQMLSVGEETGAVDDLMQEVADFYEREVEVDIKNLSSAIEPILIVAIGIMVLILALGVFLPMWDLASAARGG